MILNKKLYIDYFNDLSQAKNFSKSNKLIKSEIIKDIDQMNKNYVPFVKERDHLGNKLGESKQNRQVLNKLVNCKIDKNLIKYHGLLPVSERKKENFKKKWNICIQKQNEIQTQSSNIKINDIIQSFKQDEQKKRMLNSFNKKRANQNITFIDHDFQQSLYKNKQILQISQNKKIKPRKLKKGIIDNPVISGAEIILQDPSKIEIPQKIKGFSQQKSSITSDSLNFQLQQIDKEIIAIDQIIVQDQQEIAKLENNVIKFQKSDGFKQKIVRPQSRPKSTQLNNKRWQHIFVDKIQDYLINNQSKINNYVKCFSSKSYDEFNVKTYNLNDNVFKN